VVLRAGKSAPMGGIVLVVISAKRGETTREAAVCDGTKETMDIGTDTQPSQLGTVV
jgi:hypothetical protein